MTTNLKVAMELARQGFAVFPCRESGGERNRKKPAVDKGQDWSQVSTSDESVIKQLWQGRRSNAIPGIDVGKTGLLVIDCDRKKGVDGLAAFAALAEENGFDLSDCPQVHTPTGGIHFYFRQPEGADFGNATGALPQGVDVRGRGGYVIGPGSVFSDDGGRYDLASDIEMADAPALPVWLDTIIRTPKVQPTYAPPPQPISVQPIANDDARVRAYIEQAMAGEIERVRYAVAGSRNTELNNAALALGHYVPHYLSEGEVRQALMSAAMQSGLVTDDGPKQCEKTITSGLRAGMAEPKQVPEQAVPDLEIAPILTTGGGPTLEEGEVLDTFTNEPFKPEKFVEPIEQKTEVMLPSGLVGDIARFILASARRPKPLLALGAALAIVGTVMGRMYAGPTQSGTHLYIVGLAVTGAGKDHPLSMSDRILYEAGLSAHIGPGEWMSQSAVIHTLRTQPLCLALLDEIGAFFRKIGHVKSSAHERNVSKVLRQLWGSSFQGYNAPQWANGQSFRCEAPALSIFGASTHDEFYRSLEAGALEDGTLNRFLVLDCGQHRPCERPPIVSKYDVPGEIITDLRSIYDGNNPSPFTGFRNDPASAPHMVNISWAPEAREAFQAYQRSIETSGDPMVQRMKARSAEMAVRIATIVAVGQHKRAISLDDMRFGIDLADRSADMMARGGSAYMAASEREAQTKKAVRLLKANDGQLSRREFMRKMGVQCRSKKDADDLILTLSEAGMVRKEERPSPRGGRPTVIYHLNPDSADVALGD